jgi:hypothetical protein
MVFICDAKLSQFEELIDSLFKLVSKEGVIIEVFFRGSFGPYLCGTLNYFLYVI